MEANQVQQVPIKSIVIGDNVRKNVDDAKLQELAASILAGGVRSPVLLTPKKAAGQVVPGKFRLVYGQRRVLASELAGKTDVPALIREDMTDDEIEVEQLVENDQREDIHPLDRADYYAKLRERGLDAQAIANRVGRARSTVELTLRLADLVDAGKKAVRAGWLKQGMAEELALLPPAVQGKGLKRLEDLDQYGDLTKEKAREVLRAEFFLDLAEAKFDLKDANLVPAAGACIPTCPKRTGAQPDLFSVGKGTIDLCTDLPCFRMKEGAWLKEREKAGARVLTGAEVKKAFPYNDRVSRDAGFVLADEKEYGARKTNRQVVGEEKVVLARAPSGALVELVPANALAAAAPAGSSAPAKHEKTAAEKRAAEQAKVRRLVAERALNAIATNCETTVAVEHIVDQTIVVAAEALLEAVGNDRRKLLATHLELKQGDAWDASTKALQKHLQQLEGGAQGSVQKVCGFILQLVGAAALGTYGKLEDLKPGCEVAGVKLHEIQKDVELERRSAAKEKAAAKVAKKKTSKREASLELEDDLSGLGHLVIQHGSTFNLTHDGEKVLRGFGRQGDQVRPGTAIVDQLIAVAGTGVGKLNLKLQRLHAKAVGK